jgi:RES domain-containing protein
VITGWDANAAVRARPLEAWKGSAWRAHNARYAADDPGGSLRVSGRYNLGMDRVPAADAWAALYLGLSQAICLGEVLRHITPATLARLSGYRLTELWVEMGAVLDCRDPSAFGLAIVDLCDDFDYGIPQRLAGAAVAAGAEGILVPSVTRLGDNLILFPQNRRAGSVVTIRSWVDPRLYVAR